MMLRLPLMFLFGLALTTGMFWLLWSLISEPVSLDQTIKATRIEFSRMRHDTQAESKRQEKVKREPPPTPEVPRMSPTIAKVNTDLPALSLNINTGANLKLGAGADTDVIPLVRIPPEYPRRALNRGIEGWVQVQFTITPTGAVKDPKVIAADPPGLFDDAAVRSILRWRYNPKIENGAAVERVGVQTIIRFVLDKGKEN